MIIFSTSSIHTGKMKLFFKVLRRNYCDMAQVHVLESFLEGRGFFIVFLEFSKTKNYGIPLMLFNYGIP